MRYTTFASSIIKGLWPSYCMQDKAGRKLKYSEVCKDFVDTGRLMGWAANDIAQHFNYVSYVNAWYGNNKQSLHLFLPKGMAKFLISAARDVSGAYYDESTLDRLSMMAAGVDSWAAFDILANGWPVTFIHFPAEEHITYPLMDGQILNENKGSMAFIVKSEAMRRAFGHKFSPSIRPGLTSGFNDFSHDTWYQDDNKECGDSINLLHGLSLYIRAFPDSLVEFTTKDKQFKGKSTLTIFKTNDVSDDIKNGISPHYRRGHFRVLAADRYKSKGKVVFVKGCFVNGRAYALEG